MTADPDQLTWYRMDRYYLQSGCERYTVSVSFGPPGTRYSAWRRAKPAPELLDVCTNPDDAKAACQANADERALAEEQSA